MSGHREEKCLLESSQGFSLIELLVVLVIFSIVMASLYSAYVVQLKQSITEYKMSQSDMEFEIGKSVIERDLAMAGFGIADDYSGLFSPKVVEATNGTPDTLTLRGTALGRGSRASQAWSYVSSTPSLTTWSDSRETLRANDRIIYVEPNLKKMISLTSGTNSVTQRAWLFPYPGSGTNPNPDPLENGVVAFGLETVPTGSTLNADFPWYVVTYSLSNSNLPASCEANIWNLIRSETDKNAGDPGQPLFNCVADFQVAFGIDDNEDGIIDCWDNGGVSSSGYISSVFRKRLKQIRVYILAQMGGFDKSYFYMGTDAGLNVNQVRVGDGALTACGGGTVGRAVTLSDAQRQYRWRVISISVAPRNIRE